MPSLHSIERLARRPRFGALCVVLACLACYGSVIGYGFVWDDANLIRDNPFLRRADTPWRTFASGFWELTNVPRPDRMYRPLVVVSYWFEYRLWGSEPAGYHLGNLGLHAANGCLVLLLGRRVGLSGLAALGAALLFVCHPVQVEAVANIASRTDLLATCAGLSGLLGWLRGRPGLALCALGCALLSKESAVVLPVWFMLFRQLVAERPGFGRVDALPWLVLGLYAALRSWALGNQGMPPLDATFQGATVVGQYLLRLAWPVAQAPIVTLAPAAPGWAWGSLALLCALLALACRGWFRKPSLVQAGLLAFFVGLLPVAEVVPMGARFADLLLYLPVVPLWLSLAAWAERRALGPVLLVGLALAFAPVAAGRSLLWTDNLSLWQHAAQLQPRDPTTNLNLANALRAGGQVREGCQRLQRAAELASGDAAADLRSRIEYNLGNCAMQARELPAARAHYLRALEFSRGGLWQAHANLVLVELAQGDVQGALTRARGLSVRFAGLPDAWLAHGATAARAGELVEARQALREALRLEPSHAGARQMLQRVEQDLAGR